MVSLEELLWKLLRAVANENAWDDPYKNFFPLEVREVEGTEQVPARPKENTLQRQRRSAAITGEVIADADAFIDMHFIPGNAKEPTVKRNCFG